MSDGKSSLPYDPRLYRLTHRGNPGDVGYYASRCSPGQEVLELGCGSGRITLALAAQGCYTTGLERHPGMLHELRQRLTPALRPFVELELGDIRCFSMRRRFDRILLPFNVLFCLLEERDWSACLDCVRRHLKPEGLCIFDLSLPEAEDLEAIEDGVWQHHATLVQDQEQIEIYEQRSWIPQSQRIDARYKYAISDPRGHREEIYSIPQIYLTLEQCVARFSRAGLSIVRLEGDFEGEAYDPEVSMSLVGWAQVAEGFTSA